MTFNLFQLIRQLSHIQCTKESACGMQIQTSNLATNKKGLSKDVNEVLIKNQKVQKNSEIHFFVSLPQQAGHEHEYVSFGSIPRRS